jgi:hypothetical protein
LRKLEFPTDQYHMFRQTGGGGDTTWGNSSWISSFVDFHSLAPASTSLKSTAAYKITSSVFHQKYLVDQSTDVRKV